MFYLQEGRGGVSPAPVQSSARNGVDAARVREPNREAPRGEELEILGVELVVPIDRAGPAIPEGKALRNVGGDEPGVGIGQVRADNQASDGAAHNVLVVVRRANLGRGLQDLPGRPLQGGRRSEENTSELQSLMRISSAVFCLKKKNRHTK